ncbi:TPA: hypothetical protein P2I16_002652 [Aeromonas salmonicida]|nr:hypothetical protein [Aeromonas salmonicida]
MKNINKIELLLQELSLLSNTTSWLVLQSFHPLLAGFFFSGHGPVSVHRKGALRPLNHKMCVLLTGIRRRT